MYILSSKELITDKGKLQAIVGRKAIGPSQEGSQFPKILFFFQF